MSNKAEILTFLDALGVQYELVSHPPVFTMEDLLPVDKLFGGRVTRIRNLFLCNRQKTNYYLLLIPRLKVFRTAEVSKKLGVSRLSFGEEDALLDMLGVTPGAVNPLSLIFDKDNDIQLVIDSDIPKTEYISFHPGENTATAVFKTDDFFKTVLPKLTNYPITIDILGE